jgi:hypothetical protein
MSVRRPDQVENIKQNARIQPFASALEFVVVPDITADHAFDTVMDGVSYIEHVASPLPKPVRLAG